MPGVKVTTNFFLVRQVRELVDMFTFSQEKLEVVRVLRKRILDNENAPQLFGAFSFSTEKGELKKILDG